MSRLFVRLPNHLGDACMTLPALDLLAARGFALTLVGRGWARSLFEAYPWPVLTPSGGLLARSGALRRAQHGADARARGLLFTNSFGTALEFRLRKRFQSLVNLDAQILGRRHGLAKRRNIFIQ